MTSKFVVSMVWLLFLTTAVYAGSGPDFREGNWEITVEIEMPGMNMKMPGTTYTQCMKKERPVPQNDQPNQQCDVKDVKTMGNTVSWTMVCKNPGGTMTGRGKISYEKEQMSGTMTMEGQGMQMISTYSGRRTGPCK